MTTDKVPPPPETGEPSAEGSTTRFNLYDAVAARIRELRMARGWSQDRLALEAGLSKDAVSRIERGERSARLDTLERLGAAVGLSLPKLVDFGETTPQPQERDGRVIALQRLLDQLDPRVGTLVVNLVRGLVRIGRGR